MMTINLVCVGNLKEKFSRDAQSEYLKRLSSFCKVNIIELKEQNKFENIELIKKKEGEEILKRGRREISQRQPIQRNHISGTKGRSVAVIHDNIITESGIFIRYIARLSSYYLYIHKLFVPLQRTKRMWRNW